MGTSGLKGGKSTQIQVPSSVSGDKRLFELAYEPDRFTKQVLLCIHAVLECHSLDVICSISILHRVLDDQARHPLHLTGTVEIHKHVCQMQPEGGYKIVCAARILQAERHVAQRWLATSCNEFGENTKAPIRFAVTATHVLLR